MCGICGIIDKENVLKPQGEAVRKMTATLLHRGPDEDGFYLKGNVAMGMRRLSIIDLKSGSQPMHNEDQSVWVVFNGFIYNYLELREQLIARGHIFYTSSDTEVLVHLYEEYKFDCVKHLNGMFAFAIWDEKEATFSLYRDRIGVKNIFYAHINGEFVFGSEMKALLTLPQLSREIDFQALDIYFSLYYIPAPFTIFKPIRRLEPAHYLVYTPKSQQVREYRYWEFSAGGEDSRPERYYAEKILELLRASVRLQLKSDVPLGLFLSGGIDSTTLLALVSQEIRTTVKTFSVGFKEKSYSELDQARLVAKLYASDHHEVIMEPQQVIKLLPDIITHLDEPNGDWSAIPNYLLSQLAKQEVSVALCGAGGDELFAGYPTYTAYYLAGAYRRLPALLKDTVIKNIVNRLPVSLNRLSFDYKAKAFIRAADADPIEAHFRWKEIFSKEAKAELYSALGKEKMRDYDSLEVFSRYDSDLQSFDGLSKLLFLDTRVFHAACTLYVTDITTMANSLECRVPFLDNAIIDFAWQIPSRLKHRGLTTKYILRQAVSRLLPKEIVRLKKKGFILPTGSWLKGPLKGFMQEILSSENIKGIKVLNEAYVRQLIDEHFTAKKDNTRQLTALISFVLWYNQYINRK
ncbi:MAG: asparagine synthase (glutamine-hydrolyzing) [Candidatus Omnitrophota bacterium]